MKIAYICADFGVPVFGHKGASIHIREMVSSWHKLGHEVTVFSPSVEKLSYSTEKPNAVEIKPEHSIASISKEIRKTEKLIGIKTRLRFDLRKLLYNLTLLKKVNSIMIEKRYDFIYERYSLFNYSGIALANEFGVPHILESQFTGFVTSMKR